MASPFALASALAASAGAALPPDLPGSMAISLPRRCADPRADDGPEAGSWIRDQRGRHALAPKRFASSREALDFVDRLREAGATRAFIPASRIRSRGFAEEADTVAFEVDSTADQLALVEMISAEASSEWQLPLGNAQGGWIRWR